MSACSSVVPGADGAALAFTDAPARLTGASGGDGDDFIDNCETWTVTFDVHNTGEVALTNVRVAHVEPVSHPETTIVDTPTFAASLAACGVAEGTFRFTAGGLEPGDTVVFRIDVTADELAPRTSSRRPSSSPGPRATSRRWPPAPGASPPTARTGGWSPAPSTTTQRSRDANRRWAPASCSRRACSTTSATTSSRRRSG